jgi:hypothetical protein
MGVWECGNANFLCGKMILLNTNKNFEKPKTSMGVWEYGKYYQCDILSINNCLEPFIHRYFRR